MGGFELNETLFLQAKASVDNANDSFLSLKTLLDDVSTNYPPNYSFKSDVNEICSELDIVKKYLLDFYNQMLKVYYSLRGLDFQNASDSSKDISRLEELYKRRAYLAANVVVNPGIITKELSEEESAEYTRLYGEYQNYINEKKAVEAEIESLERKNNIYQNKWYEDLAEASIKNNAAWESGIKQFFSGEGTDGLKLALNSQIATTFVIDKAVANGAMKGIEKIYDGAIFLGGTVIAPNISSLFVEDQYKEEVKKGIKDFSLDYIRRDLVGESNYNFYNNNQFGQLINENSYLKYDSAGAIGIEKGTEFATKIVIATGATVLTGGIGAAALGALYGTGETTERYTQSVDRENGEEYNYKESIIRAIAGATTGALEFYGYGKMGQALLVKTGVVPFEDLFVKKITTSFRDNFINNLFTLDNWTDTAAVLVDNWKSLVFAEVTPEEFRKQVVREVIVAIGLNVFNSSITANAETTMAKKIELSQSLTDSYRCDDIFSDIKKSSGHYGNDQASLNSVTRNVRLNNDWLKDKEKLSSIVYEFLEDNNLPISDYDKAMDAIIDGSTLSERGHGKKIIFKYLESEGVDVIDTFNKSFRLEKASWYDRVVKKYMQYGLTEEQVVKILQNVDNPGACTYAAVMDNITSAFSDKPEEFKKLWGFDLFVDEGSTRRFNTEELLSDMYFYVNNKSNVADAMMFDNVDGQLTILSSDPYDRLPLNGGKNGFRGDILNSYFQSKSPDLQIEFVDEAYNPGIWFGDFSINGTDYHGSKDLNLEQFKNDLIKKLDDGYNIELSVFEPSKEFYSDKIFTFYNSDGIAEETTKGWGHTGHSIFVTDVIDNDVVISTWDGRYTLPIDDFVNNHFYINTNKIIFKGGS